MFVEAELFTLPARNANRCICFFKDNNKRDCLLVVNTAQLFSLVTGVGFNSDRYALERVQAAGVPDGAELVACKIVAPSRSTVRRNDGKSTISSSASKRISGMLCLVMRPPRTRRSVSTSGGKEEQQGDAAAGPQPPASIYRKSAATPMMAAPAGRSSPVLGLLNVYELQSNRGIDLTDGSLQREPQQIALHYDPEGIAHVPVWRYNPRRKRSVATNSAAAMPSTADGENLLEERGDAMPSTADGENLLEERGDAILMWGRDGVVRGYVRWESAITGRAGVATQQRKGSNGNNNGINDGCDPNSSPVLIREESRASLAELIPELTNVGSSFILCISADTVEDDSRPGPERRVRNMIIGCRDGTYLVSSSPALDSRNRNEVVTYSCLMGGAATTALNTPFPTPASVLGKGRQREAVGFACGQLGMVTCFTKEWETSIEEGKTQWPTMASMSGAARILDADAILCMGCADFCRDGSITVAVGTKYGTVTIYDVLRECSNNNWERQPAGAEVETNGGSTCNTFEIEWRDEEDEDEEEATNEAQRRGDSTSPRVSAERRFAGGSTGRSTPLSSNKLRQMAFKWQKHVPYPVFGVIVGDFNADGIAEMVVVTKYGIHVLRPDYGDEASRLSKILGALKILEPREDKNEERKVQQEESTESDWPIAGSGACSLVDECVGNTSPSLTSLRAKH